MFDDTSNNETEAGSEIDPAYSAKTKDLSEKLLSYLERVGLPNTVDLIKQARSWAENMCRRDNDK